MGSVDDHRSLFDGKLRDAWNRGMSKSEVVYEESTSCFENDHGIPYEIRYLPCLDKKPTDDRTDSPSQDHDMDGSSKDDGKDDSSAPRDPFAPPRDNIVLEMETYTCVLNKYALERGHFLCVTNDWFPQKGLLRACDLRIIYDLISNLSVRHYCFFNGGVLAGASQEHRHFQFLSIPKLDTPCWPDQIYLKAPKSQQVQHHTSIPAHHFLLPILDSTTPGLEATFNTLHRTAQIALQRNDEDMPYNFMLTKEYMMIFPRRNEQWDAFDVGVGGTCLAGQIMVTSKSDIDHVRRTGIREILQYVGFPTNVTQQPIKDEEMTDAATLSYNSGLNTEDPDVRLAAEVLSDLKSFEHSPAFLNRVSEYPIVSTAVRAYETGKTSSRAFDYAATKIESIARPVVSRFEPLDDFACRQLDRIEGRSRPRPSVDLESGPFAVKRKSIDEKDDLMDESAARSRGHSRWHSVLNLSLSEDSLKSLKYCSEWLTWANGHVNHLLGGLHGHVDSAHAQGDLRNMSPEELSHLSSSITYVKREISETLKKLMGIVSNYAGTALPEPARSRVRGYVLGMPSRWAARQSSSPPRRDSYPPEKIDELSELDREYGSVTSLANESLEVLRNVSDIVARTIASFTRR